MERAALEAERRLLGRGCARSKAPSAWRTAELVGGYLLARLVPAVPAEHPAVEIELDSPTATPTLPAANPTSRFARRLSAARIARGRKLAT
jgi:hypothetical protein